MTRYKQAIRFPGVNAGGISIEARMTQLYSEQALHEVYDTLIENYDKFSGLLGYLIQCNRTNELQKQISVKERGLDQIVEEKRKQVDVSLSQEAERWQLWEKYEKERLTTEMERLHLEAAKVLSEFADQYELEMRENRILRELITYEIENIEQIKKFVFPLEKNCGTRREYIQCCDLLRRCTQRLSQYLHEMI